MNYIIDLLKLGLDGSYSKNQAISNNIANVSTPNYKRQDVEFKSVLRNNISEIKKESTNINSINLEKSDDSHLKTSSLNNKYFAKSNQLDTQYRNDGNNVDIDTEMAKLAKNNLYYNTLSQQISSKFSMIKEVIDKGSE